MRKCEQCFESEINKLNIKKATGFDGISAKMIKLAKPVVTGPITSFINKSIETSSCLFLLLC
jgi:hypothetical protein